MQIIINRIALLMQVPDHATRLKWAVFFTLLAIILGTFCIFIPARLQINPTYVYAYNIWIPIKKSILLAVDVALNLCFIYLVRSHLIAAGLMKYQKLYRFNLYMVFISIILDVGRHSLQLGYLTDLPFRMIGSNHQPYVSTALLRVSSLGISVYGRCPP